MENIPTYSISQVDCLRDLVTSDLAFVVTGNENFFFAVRHQLDIPWSASWEDWNVLVYDWDTVIVPEAATVLLPLELKICERGLPCSLELRGEPLSAIKVTDQGAITCILDAGCTGVTLKSLNISCQDGGRKLSVVTMRGTKLSVLDSSFRSCSSMTDGALVQGYDKARVDIVNSDFEGLHSSGFGGAVSALGSILSIKNSRFVNCSSNSGGGAIWSFAYHDCLPPHSSTSVRSYSTYTRIVGCLFDSCSTKAAGGALLADSNVGYSEVLQVLEIDIAYTKFNKCAGQAEGGAIRLMGADVVAYLDFTEISGCYSLTMGGGISASYNASLSLSNSILKDNIAAGLGGGALHLNNSFSSVFNTTSTNSSAVNGGGGALMWQGTVSAGPGICPIGMGGASAACAPNDCEWTTCEPCIEGKFQPFFRGKECLDCPAGTYSDALSSPSCAACMAGQYSSAVGAHRCDLCGEGLYSGAGASVCSICVVGIYKNSTYVSQNHSTEVSLCKAESSRNGTIGRLSETGSYGNNEKMYWILAPESAKEIILTFSVFDTSLWSDVVEVYSCFNRSDLNRLHLNSSCTLLGRFSGSTLPNPVTSTTGFMLVVFTSDNRNLKTSHGWKAFYQAMGNSSKTSTRSYHELKTALQGMVLFLGSQAWKHDLDASQRTKSRFSFLETKWNQNLRAQSNSSYSMKTEESVHILVTAETIQGKGRQSPIPIAHAEPIIRADIASLFPLMKLDGQHLMTMGDEGSIRKEIMPISRIPIMPSKNESSEGNRSAEEQSMLQELYSVSLTTHEELCSFHQILMKQMGASSAKEMVSIVLGLEELANPRNGRNEKASSHGSANFHRRASKVSSRSVQDTLPVPSTSQDSFEEASPSGKVQNILTELSYSHKSAQRPSKSFGIKTNLLYLPRRMQLRALDNSSAALFNQFCGANNSARYGPCLASDYKRLYISGNNASMYSGVPIVLTVMKKDAYNQTMKSDSSSLLIAKSSQGDSRLPDPAVSFVGGSLAGLQSGAAEFLFGIKPTATST
jgi:hypothetical protein